MSEVLDRHSASIFKYFIGSPGMENSSGTLGMLEVVSDRMTRFLTIDPEPTEREELVQGSTLEATGVQRNSRLDVKR